MLVRSLSLVFTGCVKDNRAIDDLPESLRAMTSGMGDGGEVGDDSSVLTLMAMWKTLTQDRTSSMVGRWSSLMRANLN